MARNEDADRCAKGIAEAMAGRASRRQVNDALDEMFESAERFADEGDRPGDAYRRARASKLDEAARMAAIWRRQEKLQAMAARNNNRFADAVLAQIAEPKAGHLAIEAQLVSINEPVFDKISRRGNQESAASYANGAKLKIVVDPILEMRRAGETDPKLAGLEEVFFSRAVEDNMFREVYQLEQGPRGNPGYTRDEHALALAKIIVKHNKVKLSLLNSTGAFVSEYAGHVAKVSHDPDKLRKASNQSAFRRGYSDQDRAVWVGYIKDRLDMGRTFGALEDPEKVLAQMWGGLIDGSHMEPSLSGEEVMPNVAARVSKSRELHWKSADAQLEYMKKFGLHSPTDAWLHGMNYAADQFGLMKVFGPRPKEGFENLLTYVHNKTLGNTRVNEDLRNWKDSGKLKARFDVVSGETSKPVANMFNGFVTNLMSAQRMSKLGLTPFAMLQDNATISRELGRQGLDFVSRHENMFSDYLKGAPDSYKQEVAKLLHSGFMETLAGATARWDFGDHRSGVVAKLENTFFRVSGITPLTANKRSAAVRMMSENLGNQHGKGFAELDQGLQRMLQAFGIGDREWTLLHKADWHVLEEQRLLTPDITEHISDADMAAYLKEIGRSDVVTPGSISAEAAARVQAPEGKEHIASAAPADSATVLAEARRDLGMKLWTYFAERGNYAVLEPGAREKALIYRGTRAGTAENLALRLLAQFKQFPVTTVTRGWLADVRGGAKGMDRVWGLVEFAALSTLYGITANYLNNAVKGQDPNATWRNQPVQAMIAGFTRGGAGSIYGDFLLGEWSRFGLSALDTLAGPNFGQVNRVAELWTNLTHMQKGRATAASAESMARSFVPYGNMIYTKMAIDYLIHYRLQEMISPGYLRRYEDQMKQRSGIEFWLRPTAVQSQGFVPALSQALGGSR